MSDCYPQLARIEGPAGQQLASVQLCQKARRVAVVLDGLAIQHLTEGQGVLPGGEQLFQLKTALGHSPITHFYPNLTRNTVVFVQQLLHSGQGSGLPAVVDQAFFPIQNPQLKGEQLIVEGLLFALPQQNLCLFVQSFGE